VLKLPRVFLTKNYKLCQENQEKFFQYLTLAAQDKLAVDKTFKKDMKKMTKQVLARQEENLEGCVNKGFRPFGNSPFDGGIQWFLFKGNDETNLAKEVEKVLEMEDSSPPMEPDCSGKPVISKPFIRKVAKDRILVTQTQIIDC